MIDTDFSIRSHIWAGLLKRRYAVSEVKTDQGYFSKVIIVRMEKPYGAEIRMNYEEETPLQETVNAALEAIDQEVAWWKNR